MLIIRKIAGVVGMLLLVGGGVSFALSLLSLVVGEDAGGRATRILQFIASGAAVLVGVFLLYLVHSMQVGPKPWHMFAVGVFTFAVSSVGAVLLAEPLFFRLPFSELSTFPGWRTGFDASPDQYRILELRRSQVVSSRDATRGDIDTDRAIVKWGIFGLGIALWVGLVAGAVKGFLIMKKYWLWRGPD